MLSVMGVKTLEVKLSKANIVLTILLGLFLLALGFGVLYNELTKGFNAMMFAVGILLVAGSVAIPLIVLRGYRKSVILFTEDGLTRYDGVKFLWSDLERVTDRISRRGGANNLWRIDFRFKNGEAWVIPQKVDNFDEVSSYIEEKHLQNLE
jgi:hypothetical protein